MILKSEGLDCTSQIPSHFNPNPTLRENSVDKTLKLWVPNTKQTPPKLHNMKTKVKIRQEMQELQLQQSTPLVAKLQRVNSIDGGKNPKDYINI